MSTFVIETSAPEKRVIRVTNLHMKATVDQLKQLFSDYKPISAPRGKNPKNKKYDVGYVFFATEADRIAAQGLSFTQMGRQLRVFPAKTGFFCGYSVMVCKL
jgi:RNA recognition motif-containing protein